MESQASKEQTGLFFDEKVEKFEGLLKSVQNHRNVVQTFEMKLDELHSHSKTSEESEEMKVDFNESTEQV